MKTKPKKNAGIDSLRQREPLLSTNVSSPMQAASKIEMKSARALRKIEGHVASGANEHNPRPQGRLDSYTHDDFCVSDSSYCEYSCSEAKKTAGSKRASRPRKRQLHRLGSPIASDPKMDNINAIHRMVVEDFVQLAKEKCDEIVMKLSLRSAPFTDTMLRDMAVRFSCTREEMLRIPGIDFDKVDCHGSQFYPLIRRAREHYENMMATSEDRPVDPNHENVVDLVSDDGDIDHCVDERAHNVEDYSDNEPDSSSGKRSNYFQPPGRIASFNAQLRQLESRRALETASIVDDDDDGDTRKVGGRLKSKTSRRSVLRTSGGRTSTGKSGTVISKKRLTKACKSGKLAKDSHRPGGRQGTITGKAISMMPT